MYGFLPFLGRFQCGRLQTAAAGTAIAVLVPPMQGAYTHVVDVQVLAGTTAHTWYLLRPLNYTTVASAAAAGQAVVNITADPGNFTGNYQYPPLNAGPNGKVAATLPTFQTANDLLGAGDYVVMETPDGAFFMTTVSSISTLAVTLATNVPTGGIAAGARFWHMGQFGDTDPATNAGQYGFLNTVSVVNKAQPSSDVDDVLSTLHVYDPIVFYDANATAADTLNSLAGFYSKY